MGGLQEGLCESAVLRGQHKAGLQDKRAAKPQASRSDMQNMAAGAGKMLLMLCLRALICTPLGRGCR